ncbi:MAG: carboxylating nicotinate-nucleotide diphosphorylase [Bdellovibrionaceae bacterium]|nr:carboxylating nicotinate-nucleotide diphosphorylase [Pseudobdellovibrionaceae bacterium]
MIIEELVKKSFQEDIPQKDITTSHLDIDHLNGRSQLIAKSDLVLSGTEVFDACIKHLDPQAEIRWHFNNGHNILAGQKMATLVGDLIQIIQAERVALNFLGHFTGISTLTSQFVNKVKHTKCKILDTRKTTPTLRIFEKKAVVDGGGFNHRMNLSDSILIKENHIALCGGIRNVLSKFVEKGLSPIHVEVKNKEEALIAFEYKVQRLLLDNMTNEQMKSIVEIKHFGTELEASGNMNLDRVTSVAELGVDYISVGALTHSAPCADISLIFDWKDH